MNQYGITILIWSYHNSLCSVTMATPIGRRVSLHICPWYFWAAFKYDDTIASNSRLRTKHATKFCSWRKPSTRLPPWELVEQQETQLSRITQKMYFTQKTNPFMSSMNYLRTWKGCKTWFKDAILWRNAENVHPGTCQHCFDPRSLHM